MLRRMDEGPEPYLWCCVQFRNFRLQVAMPFCQANHGVIAPRFEHIPSLFLSDSPRGAIHFSWLN